MIVIVMREAQSNSLQKSTKLWSLRAAVRVNAATGMLRM